MADEKDEILKRPYKNFIDGETVLCIATNETGKIIGSVWNEDLRDWVYQLNIGISVRQQGLQFHCGKAKAETTPAPVTHPLFTEAEFFTLKANLTAQILSGMSPHHVSDRQPLVENAMSYAETIIGMLGLEFEDRAEGIDWRKEQSDV